MKIIAFIFQHFFDIVSALIAVLTALIGFFLLIPGDQPEKTLQVIVDFLKSISKK